MEHLRILLMCSLLSTAAADWCDNTCQTCVGFNNCAKCKSRYYKSGGSCIKCFANCDSCSSSGTCDTCSAGYYRLSETNCVQCRAGCSGCTGNTQCTNCEAGYYIARYPSGTYCVSCSSQCTSCTSYTQCGACKAGYYTYSVRSGETYCSTCSARCTSCITNTWCDQCEAGSYRAQDASNNMNCYTCPTHCTSCSSNTQCSECEIGYYGVTCSHLCQDHCVNGACTQNGCTGQCRKGYYKDGNVCKGCPDGCAACWWKNSCYQCETGYYQDSNVCNKCGRNNCESCSSAANCNQCEAGYYMTQNQYCYQCLTQCTSCSSSTQCTACKTGLYGVTCSYSCLNHCVNSECAIAGCTRGCKAGYYRHNNICYACPTHCATCSSATKCSTCDTGYSGDICNQCNVGYYKDQNQDCLQCSSVCTRCSSSTQCTACKYGRYGTTCDHSCSDHCVDGECTQSGCTSGCQIGLYKDSDNVCKTCSSNCPACSSGTYCNQCDTGYYLQYKNAQNQDCQRCPSYCSSCESSTKCTACNYGHYGVTCDYSCYDHCVDDVCTQSGCTRGCRDSYYKDNDNVCKTCSPNCNGVTKCNPDNGACVDGCKPRWTGAKCLENCPVNCTDCNQFDSNQCITCERGYYGASCENKCSAHCINNNTIEICIKDNGTCSLGCVQGHWGNNCNNDCSKYCINTLLCSTKDGGCDRCTPERYGHHCELECSNNCDNPNNGSNICDRGTGACLYGCTSGKSGATCGEDGSISQQIGDKTDNTPAIAGGAGGVVILAVVVVVVLCIVLKKRRKRGSSNTEEETPVTLADNEYANCQVSSNPVYAQREESAFIENKRPISNGDSKKVCLSNVLKHSSTTDADEVDIELDEDEDDMVPVSVPDQSPDTYYNMAGLVRSQIAVDKLQNYANARSNDDFEKEFEKLPTGLTRPCNAAMQNRANNRYAQIYPYDASRVVLQSGPSDYINASYIDNYSQYNTYIASLGPTNKTMPGYVSFWTMVWQEKVEVIVMLTNLMEGGTMKCEQYWPDTGTSMTYDDVTVTCHSEDVYAEYTVRSFTVQTTEKRTLHHIHYTAWPDKGVPDDVTSLIEFRQRAINCPMKLGGPTIVHCSAGIGRSGTYIALDILTREGRAEKSVDVFGCVMAMRGQRVNMVQTAEQYGYLHNALVHSLTFDCDPIQSNKVQDSLRPRNERILQAQFQHLQHTTDVIPEDEKKAVTENKTLTEKNRPGADIPGKRHRPWLHLLRKPGSSNYINAVFVNSVGMYLPAPNEVTKHGVFQVKCNSCETKPQYTLRQLQISTHGPNSLEPRYVYHFECTIWGKGDNIPKDPAAFLQLTRDVERMSQEAVDTGPIVVHCFTGAERSGLFCVVSNLIQKMEIEHQVSVVNTVRQVKARRRRAIPDKYQYLFCHQCLSDYIQSFETYSNFSL